MVYRLKPICIFANELMKEAAQTYNANHPAGVMVNDDVNNVMDQLISFESAGGSCFPINGLIETMP